MDTGFKIFIYFTLFVIWIISLINKFYKKNPKIKEESTIPVNPSAPETNSVTSESQPSKVVNTEEKTILEKNPYSESVGYRKRMLGRKYQERMLSKKKERERVNTKTEKSVSTSTIDVDAINWKQAIIHSEILNRRF